MKRITLGAHLFSGMDGAGLPPVPVTLPMVPVTLPMIVGQDYLPLFRGSESIACSLLDASIHLVRSHGGTVERQEVKEFQEPFHANARYRVTLQALFDDAVWVGVQRHYPRVDGLAEGSHP